MSSWREIASIEAQNDLDGLLEAVLTFGKQQLARYAEFFPFAAVVDTDGTVEMIAALPETRDHRPLSAALLDACITALRSNRDAIRAGAVASDIRLPSPAGGDAIQVDLEHGEGHALTILLPYTKKPPGQNIEYGTITAQPGTHRIWPVRPR